MEGVLPGAAVLERERGIAVRQVLKVLEDGDKGEQHRREGRFAVIGIEVGEVLIVELLVEHIADEAVGAVGVEERGADPPGLLGHRARWLRFEATYATAGVKAGLPLHGMTAVNGQNTPTEVSLTPAGLMMPS